MNDYPSERDCEHGHMRRKCPICEERTCSTCGGDPQSHPSGLPCVCGDGTRDGEVRGLRLAAFTAQQHLTAERAAHEQTRIALLDAEKVEDESIRELTRVQQERDEAIASAEQRADERDRMRAECDSWRLRVEAAERERDDAVDRRARVRDAHGLETAQLRTEIAQTRASLDEALSAIAELTRERDEALAKLAARTAEIHDLQRLLVAAQGERDLSRDEARRAVEAAAIGEWVIAALRGEVVSDFALSFAPVREARDLVAERDCHGERANTAQASAERSGEERDRLRALLAAVYEAHPVRCAESVTDADVGGIVLDAPPTPCGRCLWCRVREAVRP